MSLDPQLIVFAGLPGTGKSSLARSVARERRAAYLDKDTIKDAVIALADRMKVPSGQQLAGPLSYELLVVLARDNLTLGLPVVLDSPASYQLYRDQVKQLAKGLRADLRLIECICTDENLLRQRVERRGQELPEYRTRNWAEYQRQRAQFERLVDRRLVVDTAQSLPLNLRKVLAYLDQPSPGGGSE